MNNFSHLRPLPEVRPWNKGKPSYTWVQRCADYAALPTSPIIITAELVTPIIHAERHATNLDSILSSAAMTDHPVAGKYNEATVVPLPLALAWVSPDGLPLWACTPLRPIGEGMDGAEYWHKRYPSHRAEFGSKLNANTTAGRYREYRVPVKTQHIERLGALAIGNSDEVIRLLTGYITHIGKKGSMGFGRVARWSVTVADHTLDDVLALRPVPVAYYTGQLPHGKIEPSRGWTPPYWFAPRWADCVVPA